jgi:hypothetical protein
MTIYHLILLYASRIIFNIHSPDIYHTLPHTRHPFKDIYHTFTWYLPHSPSYLTPIQGHISYIHLIFTTLSFILDTHSRTYIIHSPDIYHTLLHTRHLFKDIYHTFTWYLPHSPSYLTHIQGHVSYIHIHAVMVVDAGDNHISVLHLTYSIITL